MKEPSGVGHWFIAAVVCSLFTGWIVSTVVPVPTGENGFNASRQTRPNPGFEEKDRREAPAPILPDGIAPDPARVTFITRQSTPRSEPVRWDPCRPIHWVMNVESAPRGGPARVKEAFKMASLTTGFRFIYDGPTDEVAPPKGQSRVYQPERYGDRWAPILVSWHETLGPEDKPALGIASPKAAYNSEGLKVYVSGDMRLSADQFRKLHTQRHNKKLQRATVLHELGHILGLGHSASMTDIMYPGITTLSMKYEPQDVVGLWILSTGPCQPDM